jgi:hypothetical protein
MSGKPKRAFEDTADLESGHLAVRHLRTNLESELNMEARKAMKRQDAVGRLPRIVRPPEANYSINEAVQNGMAEPSARWSLGSGKISTVCTKSEALVIHFSDGSIRGIETGSNART